MPPQSIALSVPFFTPSLQVGPVLVVPLLPVEALLVPVLPVEPLPPVEEAEDDEELELEEDEEEALLLDDEAEEEPLLELERPPDEPELEAEPEEEADDALPLEPAVEPELLPVLPEEEAEEAPLEPLALPDAEAEALVEPLALPEALPLLPEVLRVPVELPEPMAPVVEEAVVEVEVEVVPAPAPPPEVAVVPSVPPPPQPAARSAAASSTRRFVRPVMRTSGERGRPEQATHMGPVARSRWLRNGPPRGPLDFGLPAPLLHTPAMSAPAVTRHLGIEFEWLLPPGRTRLDLARALARAFGGRLLHGWKYASRRALPDGRPDCELTPAFRVLDSSGVPLFTLVDDVTIERDLDSSNRGVAPRLRTDDVRLALWAESISWSPKRGVEATLQHVIREFRLRREEGRFIDPWGHPLLIEDTESAERLRVCELVTRPLRIKELDSVLPRALEAAQKLGCTLPHESATHLHLDAKPWRTTATLRRLILGYASARGVLQTALTPNPACRKLGPFPAKVIEVARRAPDELEFRTFATALSLAGAIKGLDMNLLGIIERHPRQPTLEVRCLPGILELAELRARWHTVESFLKEVLS